MGSLILLEVNFLKKVWFVNFRLKMDYCNGSGKLKAKNGVGVASPSWKKLHQ